jgi:hypothetical protein
VSASVTVFGMPPELMTVCSSPASSVAMPGVRLRTLTRVALMVPPTSSVTVPR